MAPDSSFHIIIRILELKSEDEIGEPQPNGRCKQDGITGHICTDFNHVERNLMTAPTIHFIYSQVHSFSMRSSNAREKGVRQILAS
jgi:hypothetical protein